MKLPIKGSRGRTVLEHLLLEPATVYQGIERHGDLGITELEMRRLYVGLHLTGCCTCTNGVVYVITSDAARALRPAADDDGAEPEVVPSRYVGDWRSPALSAKSARRSGAAFGVVGPRGV